MTRRRLNLDRLSDQILRALYDHFFDDGKQYVTFDELRSDLPSSPANAIRLELNSLIANNKVIQRTETRTKSNFLNPANPETTYTVTLDGYKLSRNGITAVEGFKDDYFAALLDRKNENVVEKDEEAWEPLALDRTDPKLREAIKNLDEVAEEVRSDNGYAASVPNERRYVLDKLGLAIKALKEDAEISLMYIKTFALEPLARIAKRFGPAALGITATAAREALISWLKSKGVTFLDDFFR